MHQGRDTVRDVTLEKYCKLIKIKVNNPHDHTRGEWAYLALHMGTLTQTYTPLAMSSWHEVPRHLKKLSRKWYLVIINSFSQIIFSKFNLIWTKFWSEGLVWDCWWF